MRRTALILLMSGALFGTSSVRAEPQADMVLLHGHVLTVDDKDGVAEAVAISGGKILKVGSDADIASLQGPGAKVIDLRGRTVTPGLIDTHAHVVETGVIELFNINLSGARTIGDIAAAVAARAKSLKPGVWILGEGWDEGKLAERRYPSASDLDRAAPANPVWLMNTTGHYGVANGLALRLAGITAKTPDPSAGTLERDVSGAPTGVLKERAMDPVLAIVPAPSLEQRRQAVVHMVERFRAEGMTGFKDPSIEPEDWRAYMDLAASGRLGADACVLFYGGRTLATAQVAAGRVKSARAELAALGREAGLHVCGVKIFMDGSGAAPTAWMYEPWNRNRTEVAEGNRGYPQTDPEAYRTMVRYLVSQGIGVGTHAIGDRAIDWVVDAYAEALAAYPKTGLRLSIIHANTPTDHAIAAMAALQARYDAGYPESQGGFTWWIGDIYAANLGPQRSLRLNPFKTYLSKGVRWGGGSDSPVTPFAARYGLWASVARTTSQGRFGPTPFGLDEAADVHAALKSYTVWAARQIAADGRVGVIAPGYDADIAIWDRNPYEVPTAALKEMRCEMTLYHGVVVYVRP